MQIFIRCFLEQRRSQYRGVFAGKPISEMDTPHANTTPTRNTTTYFTASQYPGGTPLCKLCRVPVWFFTRFGHKKGIDICNFGLK